MSEDCIFCKIIKGDIPSVKIFEDETVLAFMDIGPVVKGHALVIPKVHCDPITNTPPELLQTLIVAVQKVAAAQIDGLGADGVNVSQANGKVAGQEVPHIHFHVIPRFTDDGHSWSQVQGKYDRPGEMEEFAQKTAAAL